MKRLTSDKSSRVYNDNEIGCHADGAFGHEHCRRVLADILEDCCKYKSSEMLELCDELRSEEWSDDLSEEDDAIMWLNEHACSDEVYFSFEIGDLMLLGVHE